MENDLVKEVRQSSKDLEAKAYAAFVKFNGKGISPEKLRVLRDALGDAQIISYGVDSSNAKAMKSRLELLSKDVDNEIKHFDSIISNNITEEELKKDYIETQKDLFAKYNELKDNGVDVSALSNLATYFNELTEEYYKVNSENVKIMSDKLYLKKVLISSELSKFINNDMDDGYNNKLEDTLEFNIEEEEPVLVKGYHKAKNKGLYKYLIGGLAGITLFSILQSSGCNPIRSTAALFGLNGEKTTEVDDNTRNAELTDTENSEVTPEIKEGENVEFEVEPSEITLKMGELGTFLDATDNEQVEARAQYIIDNYYSKWMDKVSDDERSQITLERISNIIRVMNGQCPLDDNGNRYYDPNVVDTYGQAFIDLVSDIPSSDVMGTVEVVPAYLFAIDGTKLQDYIKTYDDLYAKVAEGRNKRDDSIYRPAAEEIARLYWFGWFLQGQNNYVNPTNFEAESRYFAYQATTSRYGSYIKEAEFNQRAAVCIDACVDYDTKLEEPLSIAEIYTAINDGIWNDIIAKSAGLEVPTEPMLVGYWHALNDQLSYVYEHAEVKTLN